MDASFDVCKNVEVARAGKPAGCHLSHVSQLKHFAAFPEPGVGSQTVPRPAQMPPALVP